MILGDAIHKLLKDDAAVNLSVGTKIYPVAAPQRTRIPFIVYADDGTDQNRSKDGTGSLQIKDIGIDVYAPSYQNAHTIANQVKEVLKDYAGTVEGIEIEEIYCDDLADGPFVEAIQAFTVSSNYRIFIKT